MNTLAWQKVELMQRLRLLPANQLETVKIFVDALLLTADSPTPNSASLQGIWQNQGWEKLEDLATELRLARQEIAGQIDQRNF